MRRPWEPEDGVDLLLLMVQVLLVILLIVIPLFSGYDKWQSWSPTRKIIAAALGLGIAIVALGQYRRLTLLHKGNLSDAFATGRRSMAPFYLRPMGVTLFEYVGMVLAGSVLMALALNAAQRKQWTRFVGFLFMFSLLMSLGMAVKLHWIR